MQLLNLGELIFGNTVQKIQKSTCFGVNRRTSKKVVLLYEPQQSKLSLENIIFLGGDVFQKWKTRI
jgi:hypothetical protein